MGIRTYLKKNCISLPLFILVFLFVYISDDTLFFGTNSNSAVISLKYFYIITMAVALTVRFVLVNRVVYKQDFVFILLLSALILLSMLANNDVRLGYFYKIALLVYALNLAYIFSIKQFSICYTTIMTWLAFFSLIAYALAYIAPNIIRMLPVTVNTANVGYYNSGLFVVCSYVYQGLVRNYGIFREPGVYQMYLVMALVLQLLVVKQNSLWRYIILVAAIATTISTTGYIALAFFLMLFVVNKEGLSNNKRLLFISLIVISVLILASTTTLFSMSSEYEYISVFGKLGNMNRNTTSARLASITENIRIACEHPIFGAGIEGIDRLFPLYALQKYGRPGTNTNTVLIQFASHGILYGLLWCYGNVQFCRKLNKQRWVWVFAILLILYIGENLTYSGFASLFLMYGISKGNTNEVDDYEDY